MGEFITGPEAAIVLLGLVGSGVVAVIGALARRRRGGDEEDAMGDDLDG